jgi:hypothetical protein
MRPAIKGVPRRGCHFLDLVLIRFLRRVGSWTEREQENEQDSEKEWSEPRREIL